MFWKRGEDAGKMEGGRFQSGDVSLTYQCAGQGEAIVFVHGFASNLATNWATPGIMKATADAGFLAAGFDGRGHGQSDRPNAPGAYTLDAMVDDVERFIDFLDAERPVVVGYSMGARIVSRLLTARPRPVRAAILGGVGAGIGSPGNFGAKIADALLVEDAREITDKVARRFRLFAESQGNDLRALAQCIQEVMQPIDISAFARVTVPVLVVAGADDDQINDPNGLAALIPNGRAEVIPNRNHMTVIGDARFKQAIVKFVKETA